MGSPRERVTTDPRYLALVERAERVGPMPSADLCWLEDIGDACLDDVMEPPNLDLGGCCWRDADFCGVCIHTAIWWVEQTSLYHRKGDVGFSRGYGAAEEDTPPYCAMCGAALMCSMSEHCIDYELEHFEVYGVQTDGDAWEFVRMVDGCEGSQLDDSPLWGRIEAALAKVQSAEASHG